MIHYVTNIKRLLDCPWQMLLQPAQSALDKRQPRGATLFLLHSRSALFNASLRSQLYISLRQIYEFPAMPKAERVSTSRRCATTTGQNRFRGPDLQGKT